MNLQSDHKNYLKVTYYDSFDEKWKKFHISMEKVSPEDENIWKYELDIAIQEIIYKKEQLHIKEIISETLR